MAVKQIEMFTEEPTGKIEPTATIKKSEVHFGRRGDPFNARWDARNMDKLYFATGKTPNSVIYDVQTDKKVCNVRDMIDDTKEA